MRSIKLQLCRRRHSVAFHDAGRPIHPCILLHLPLYTVPPNVVMRGDPWTLVHGQEHARLLCSRCLEEGVMEHRR